MWTSPDRRSSDCCAPGHRPRGPGKRFRYRASAGAARSTPAQNRQGNKVPEEDLALEQYRIDARLTYRCGNVPRGGSILTAQKQEQRFFGAVEKAIHQSAKRRAPELIA